MFSLFVLSPQNHTLSGAAHPHLVISCTCRQSSGLAGLSFDEGEFGVFGYVTQVSVGALPNTPR